MPVQVIDIKPNEIQLNINGVICLFSTKPLTIFKHDELLPVQAKVKGSCLYWYINGDISYNQIKKALNEALK